MALPLPGVVGRGYDGDNDPIIRFVLAVNQRVLRTARTVSTVYHRVFATAYSVCAMNIRICTRGLIGAVRGGCYGALFGGIFVIGFDNGLNQGLDYCRDHRLVPISPSSELEALSNDAFATLEAVVMSGVLIGWVHGLYIAYKEEVDRA